MDNGTNIYAGTCKLDASGRVVLPLEIRAAQSLHRGDDLVATIENGAIVLRRYEDAMQRLQDAFSKGIADDVSLVDELIADRRKEAAREARD
jgi:bifunctional DNA-binding transcriptional regulator/antitoxin component of YhaV-PrlF toxin-antitoxin module